MDDGTNLGVFLRVYFIFFFLNLNFWNEVQVQIVLRSRFLFSAANKRWSLTGIVIEGHSLSFYDQG